MKIAACTQHQNPKSRILKSAHCTVGPSCTLMNVSNPTENIKTWRFIILLCPLLLVKALGGREMCVDVGRDQFNCTDDVFATRYQVDGSTIDVGVTQRIDGSEIEKTAIREVLRRMDHYFFNEVLAMPEYEYARQRW